MDNRSAGSSGFGSFFRYHGWLAPGVRLFRSISFPAKAAWISGMFLVPLGLMLWLLWSGASDQITSTRSEQAGLVYVEPVTELITAIQNQRRAAMAKAADLAEAQAKTQRAFDAVAAQQKAFGPAAATAAGFEALRKALGLLAQTPPSADTDDLFTTHTAAIDAAIGLIAHIADDSLLALDPELDTYHLMNVGVLLGPQYSEYLARLRDLGYTTLLEKEALSAKRNQLLHNTVALVGYVDEHVESSFKQGVENFPEVAPQFDMQSVDSARNAFLAALEKQVLGDSVTGDSAAFLALASTAVEQQRTIDKQLRARLDAQLQARTARIQHTIYLDAGLCLVFVLMALYLMQAFYKVMMGGLREVAGHLTEITQGNLTTAPQPWGSDEAAQLMLTMGAMQSSLRNIARNVRDGAASVQTASEEIASASHDLSQRTEANAASLQQSAASMEQIAATVKHSADTVQGASAIVRDNAAAATRGGEVIAQVVHTMENIRTSSHQIGDIISVIDGIAFQTNILALNAAVEAARAGEQGRGFAVVATEVRALAGRSAAAAKEIKTLISTSIQQVEAGTQVVAQAGETIHEIVANAGKIDALMAEIATATREQTQGINEVGAAIHDLDQGTQQNAALVEQTAAASGSLAEQAQRLADDIAFFQFK
nr:methyl-accepting chemotaxis protein [uncultured Albidiferax sp.]